MQVQAPTETDIRKFMPADVEYVASAMRGHMLDSSSNSVQVQSQAADLNDGGAHQPSEDSRSVLGSSETVSQKHSEQLDQKLIVREQETLARMQARCSEYNATVKCLTKDSLS